MSNELTRQIRRDEKGRFLKGCSGNPSGRPVDAPMFALNQALRIYRKRHRRDIMYHFVQQAYHDNKVLIALMKKLLPDKLSGEFKGDSLGDTKILIIQNNQSTQNNGAHAQGLLQRLQSKPEIVSE